MADLVGQQLGNYHLVRLLGRGGFAEVYLGEHIHLNTQAAVKVLYTHLDSDDLEKFRNEARTIARLEHPHIVRVLDFGVEDGVPFLIMQYAPHGTLRHRHPRGTTVPLITIVSYVQQIADALQYAHDEKLIHRDIKPENMLLGRHDEILLSDFGLATIAQSGQPPAKIDVAGTVTYMAPEQLRGKPAPASDQYALGIVIYEWLCGDYPFHGYSIETAIQHILHSPTPLHEKVPGVAIVGHPCRPCDGELLLQKQVVMVFLVRGHDANLGADRLPHRLQSHGNGARGRRAGDVEIERERPRRTVTRLGQQRPRTGAAFAHRQAAKAQCRRRGIVRQARRHERPGGGFARTHDAPGDGWDDRNGPRRAP